MAQLDYYRRNRERLLEKAKLRYRENRQAKKEYDAVYRVKNRERINERYKAWRLANLEDQKAKEIARRAANPELYKATAIAWRAKNAAKLREYEAKRARTPERIALTRDASRAWKDANKEARRAQVRNRRAKLRDGGVLPKDIEARLMAAQGGKCKICGIDISRRFHLDHVVPVSRGGTNTDDNVQLLCPPCNQRKGDKLPWEFKPQRAVA